MLPRHCWLWRLMGKRRRGGRRAAGNVRFAVAFVLEELVRDVEALWYCRAGPDDDDYDRCDRHAFCDAASLYDWDRYTNPYCCPRRPCAFCNPAAAVGCKACAGGIAWRVFCDGGAWPCQCPL